MGAVGDLVVGAQGGDQDAWGGLVDRYLPMVHAICRGCGLDGDEAAAVNELVWLRLAEQIEHIRTPDAVGGWVAATTRNECVRVLRAAGRPGPDDGAGPGMGDPVDLGLLVYERDRVLMSAFARLDGRAQRLLRLLIADPRPSAVEIGAALDIPLGAIGPTRSRCLDELRRLLAEPG
jgi:DNA-directed RNA polymerase specialized sigma24 family protein